MATTEEKFDIITTDPLDPWMAGSAALYSVEYYELARQRLNEGGFISQWMAIIETDEATVKSLVGSFLEVFPEGTIWSNRVPGDGGNDFIMLGQVAPLRVDADDLTSRLEENPALETSLAEVKIEGALRLLAAYVGQKRDLAQWLEGAQINRERSLRLQYLAGFSVERYEELEIYRSMAAYRRYPEDLFVAPPGTRERVQARWSQ